MGAKHIIDELVVLLGFEADTDKATMFKETMKQINDVAKTMAAGMTGVVAGISYFAITTAKSVQENAEFAKSMDISYEAMQRYQYAIEATGGNAESARNDIDLLAMVAKRSGVTIEQAAADISSQFEGMGDMEASKIGAGLGFSEDTIRLLRKGKEGVKGLFAEANKQGAIIPENAPEKAISFNAALHSLTATIAGIKSTAIVSILEPITKVMQAIKKWVGANKELISSSVKAFIEGVIIAFKNVYSVASDIAGAVMSVVEALGFMGSGLDKVGIVAKIVEGALVVLAALMATSFLAGVLGMVVPLYTLISAIVTATTVTGAFNAVLALNPFVAVAIAIVALAVGCYFLYRALVSLYDKSAAVRLVMDTLWEVLKLVAEGFWIIGKSVLDFVISPFKIMYEFVTLLYSALEEWNKVIPIFAMVGTALKMAFAPLFAAYEVAKLLLDVMMKIPGVKKLVGNIGDALTGGEDRRAKSLPQFASQKDELAWQSGAIDRSQLTRKVRPTNMSNQNNQNSTVNQTININGSQHPSVTGQEIVKATNNSLPGATPGARFPIGAT